MTFISSKTLVGNPGYAIYFDNVRVDEFVTDFSVNMGIDGGIGTAIVNMIYMPDFDKIIHDQNKSIITTPEAPTPEQPSTTKIVVEEQTNKGEVHNCSALHVRSGPSTKNSAIGWIHPKSAKRGDHEVEILGESNKWYKVKFYHTASKTYKTGWSHSNYIKRITKSVTKTVDTKAKSSNEKKYVKVTASGNLNVRSGASTSYKIVGKVKNGTKHEYTEESNGWYKITISGTSTTGWASGKYLQKDSSGSTNSDGGSETTKDKEVMLIGDDGIENMTNVRIFVKNIFTGGYHQVFGGNIRAKSVTLSGNKNSLSFQAEDYMNWLNRTICPIAVPWDGTLSTGDRLKWKAQGIDLDKVKTVNTVNDITFKGKNISQVWQTLAEQTVTANKIYSDSNSVSAWDKPVDRVVVMGDIDENLRKSEVIDFMITSNATAVNSVYVFMNEVLKTLMFEFYQDRDETIRIKPPFWNEHVLRSHVIDSSLILNYTETTNYNNYYTRVVASGGLEKWQEESTNSSNTSSVVKSILTPVVAVTSGGITSNSGPVVVTSGGAGSTTVSSSSSSSGQAVVDQCRKLIGWPYVWGGEHPSEGGFDCSGLIQYAAKMAGHAIPGSSRHTTKTLIKLGTSVSKENLAVGDLVFTSANHVQIYSGNGKIIEAPRTGLNVREVNIRNVWAARRIFTGTNNSGGSNTSNDKTYTKPDEVGPDSLLTPTYMERKFGPKVHDVSQPLIKFSTSGATNSANAYDALAKYARFMINYLVSGSSLASIQTVAMPWIRPGFNVWVDPVRTDKVFYVNNISHFGNASACYTTLNLTMGRKREDFINNKDMVGALKPGQSDDIFVNKLLITPEKFGSICDYNDILSRSTKYHQTSDASTRTLNFATNPYHLYLYGDSVTSSQSVVTTPAKASPAPETKSKPTTVTGKLVNLGNNNLNIRSGPGTTNKIIGKMKQGQTVTIKGESGVWYKIDYNGKDGWCHSKYVSKNATTSTSSGTQLKGTVYNCSALNVRSGPSTSKSIIGSLKSGASVDIIKKSGDWYNINYKGNTNAWCSGKYIKENTQQNSSENKSNDKTPTYAVQSSVSIPDLNYDLQGLQKKLDQMYSSAPSVVKERANRLKALINTSKSIAKGMYVDK